MDAILRAVRAAVFAIVWFPNGLSAGEIWDGGGADSNWTTGANWNATPFIQIPPPNNGTANIHMAGNQRVTNVVDVPWSINSLTFDSGAISFFVTGQELTIGGGGITNDDNSNQLVTAPVRLSADQTWNAAAGLLVVNPINLNAFDLTLGGAFNTTLSGPITGSGTLTLPDTYSATATMSGNANNTYIGDSTVEAGTLLLSKISGAQAIPGNLLIGQGAGPPAIVRLSASEQISHAPGTTVNVAATGVLDLNGHIETVARLRFLASSDALVTTGTGKLVIVESIAGNGSIVGNVDLNGGNPTFDSGGQVPIVIDGVISNGGVQFGGTATLRGAPNTYTGLTVVWGEVILEKSGVDGGFRGDVRIGDSSSPLATRGIVRLGADEQILAAPGNELFVDSSEFQLFGHSETVQDLTLKDATVGLVNASGGGLTVLGQIRVLAGTEISSRIFEDLNLAGTREINVASATGNFLGLAIAGNVSNGAILKTGPGVLGLSGVNSYSGGTFINEGALLPINDASLGAPSGPLHFDGGTFWLNELSSANSFPTTGRTITWGPNGGTFDIGRTASPTQQPLTFTLPTQTLSGPGALTKLGPGTLVLLAPQSYSGGTSVVAGTLQGNTQSLQGDILTQAAGTVAFNVVTDGTYAGNLTGAGALLKLGAGTLLLTGNNPYSGTTTINAGTLRLGNSNSIGALSALTLGNTSGAVLDLNNHSLTIGSLAGGGTAGGNVLIGGGTLTTGGNNSSTAFNGVISGTGGVTKTGTGTWTLTGNNTYSGGTTFAGGVTSASSEGNLGDPTGALRFDGGTLRVTGGFNTTARAVQLLAGSGLEIANAVNSFTYSGNISGPGGLNKLGTGVLILEGNNSYGGGTTVNAGILRSVGGAAIPDGSAVTLADAAGVGFDLNSANEIIGSLDGGGAAGGNVTLGTATLTTGGDNSSTTFAGSISGSGGLVKTGTGIFTLGGQNSHTGLTDIQQGTLRLGSLTAVSTGTAVHVAATATLDLNDFDKTLSSLTGTGQVTLGTGELALGSGDASSIFAGDITGSGPLVKIGVGTLTLDGANAYTGGTTVLAGTLRGAAGNGLQGDIINQSIVQFAQATNGSYRGVLSGPGSLIKTGPGRATITTPATYTGTTLISAGTLAAANTLNAPGDAIQIEVNGALEASGNIQRRISGAGTLTAIGNLVAGDITSNSGFQTGAVNVGSHGVVLLDADRAHIGGGTIAGGSLTTLASLELSGGSFSGHGTVNGTFINHGAVAGPVAPQALAFAGPLSGAGSFSGNIRILDSFSPGNSPAAVTLENVSFGDEAVLTMELAGLVAGIDYDTLSISGTARLDGLLDVVRDPAWSRGPQSGDQFRLLQGGTIEGTFDEMVLPALSGDLSWQVIQMPQQLTLVVVPEPSTALLMIAGGLLFQVRRGRKSHEED